MRINRKVYNYIDYELSNYKSYEKKIEAIKQEIISSSPQYIKWNATKSVLKMP